MLKIFNELKRRNVVRAVIAYLAAAGSAVAAELRGDYMDIFILPFLFCAYTFAFLAGCLEGCMAGGNPDMWEPHR